MSKDNVQFAAIASALIAALSVLYYVVLDTPRVAPLPDSVRVAFVPSDPAASGRLAGFVGKWGGNWSGGWGTAQGSGPSTNLYVERVDPDGTAYGTYVVDAEGHYAARRQGGQFTGQIRNGILTWTPNHVRFEFRLLPDGTLEAARYNGDTKSSSMNMTRVTQ